MPTNVFLDTNIVIDLFDDTRMHSKGSLETAQKLLEEGVVLYVNSDTLTTLYYVLTSRAKVSHAQAIGAIKETAMMCGVVSIGLDEVNKAVALCEDAQTAFKDYEDTMQYVCAQKIGAAQILTNDRTFTSPDIQKCATMIC